jgi:hypothetical protein
MEGRHINVLFLAYVPYFENIKLGLCNYRAFRVSV